MEFCKQLLNIARRKTGTRILDADANKGSLQFRRNERAGSGRCVSHHVLEKIGDYLQQQRAIPLYGRQVRRQARLDSASAIWAANVSIR